MRYPSLILVLFFLIVGCSSKNSPTPQTQKSVISVEQNSTQSLEDDEFADEFGDETKKIFDPLEGYNRMMTNVNDKIYVYAFNPLSKGYAFVTPKPLRVGVSNAFDNLKFPIRFVNNILQLKFDHSIKELGRFMVNSTIGVLGLFDVATKAGIKRYDEDFGQTLGYWGVGSGFHVVLPFFGPSNLRDTLGFAVDTAISPTTDSGLKYQLPKNNLESLGYASLYYTNKNSLHLGEYENLKKDALDVYTFFRDSYEQKRAKDIAQ